MGHAIVVPAIWGLQSGADCVEPMVEDLGTHVPVRGAYNMRAYILVAYIPRAYRATGL